MACLGKAAADGSGRQLEQAAQLGGRIALVVAQGEEQAVQFGELIQHGAQFHRAEGRRGRLIGGVVTVRRQQGGEQCFFLGCPADLVAVEVPRCGKQLGLALALGERIN